MKLVIDVHYNKNDFAIAAGISFTDWTSDKIIGTHIVRIDKVAPYKSGSFYERELPCVLALIDSIEQTPEMLIIDGYVTLGSEEQDGLGAHLYNALDSKIPVIGVAKNRFSDTSGDSEILRGVSKHPLFVTSKGIDKAAAKELILNMHGKNRLPTLLKMVDRKCRDAILGL